MMLEQMWDPDTYCPHPVNHYRHQFCFGITLVQSALAGLVYPSLRQKLPMFFCLFPVLGSKPKKDREVDTVRAGEEDK